MMNFKYALLLSSVAGLSTCLGIVFTYFKPKNVEKFMTISLSMLTLAEDNTKKCIDGLLEGVTWNNEKCAYTDYKCTLVFA